MTEMQEAVLAEVRRRLADCFSEDRGGLLDLERMLQWHQYGSGELAIIRKNVETIRQRGDPGAKK